MKIAMYFIIHCAKRLTGFLIKSLLKHLEKGGVIHELVSVNARTVLVGKPQVKKPLGELCANVLMVRVITYYLCVCVFVCVCVCV
jgi:hypothetical protein